MNKSVFFEYLNHYKKNFIILILVFFVGIMGGIMFINHASENQMQEIGSYVNSLKENIKSADEINQTAILMQSMKQNILLVLMIWFLGCTILGSFLIYLGIAYKGFSIGYTVSAMVATLGVKTGSIFAILSLLLQNLVFLPVILILAESGIKLYKNLRENQFMNLKFEFLRHTVIMLIAMIGSVMASFIEVYGSTNFLIFFKDFF